MRKDCDTCLHDEFGETYCNDCYWANGKPPTKWEPAPFWEPDTNADRIRAMSDEELGIFLAEWAEKPWTWKKDGEGECLAWLKQPAEEENQ